MTPLTYTVEQAAERLGGAFTVDWLKHRMSELPRVKAGNGTGRGGRIGFTEAHLQQIVARYSIDPAAPVDGTGPVTRRRSA